MKTDRITYYPGCTLPEKAKNFEETIRATFSALKVEVDEMPNWYCCGAAFPLAVDNLMKLLAPARNLAHASRMPGPLVTGCAVCYHVLKRTQYLLSRDEEKRKKITDFLEEEVPPVKVMHLLEFLLPRLEPEKNRKKIKFPLSGLKVGCYYGCMMLRPAEEIDMDDPENPSIFEKLMEFFGAEAVDFPHRTECCGSYLTVNSPQSAIRLVKRIIDSLTRRGAEAVVTTCPLCYFNLDRKQEEIKNVDRSFKSIPVFYFTELTGIALGKSGIFDCFPYHRIDPVPLLEEKALIGKGKDKIHVRT